MKLSLFWYKKVRLKRINYIWKLQNELSKIQDLALHGKFEASQQKAAYLSKDKRIFKLLNTTNYSVVIESLQKLIFLLSVEETFNLMKVCIAEAPKFCEIFLKDKNTPDLLNKIKCYHDNEKVHEICDIALTAIQERQTNITNTLSGKLNAKHYKQAISRLDTSGVFRGNCYPVPKTNQSNPFFCYTPMSRKLFFNNVLGIDNSRSSPNTASPRYDNDHYFVWLPPSYTRKPYKE